jgi:hypothetical protein
MSVLSSLTEKRRKAVEYRAKEVTFDSISTELGLCISTVKAWFGEKGPLRDYLEKYKAELAEESEKNRKSLQSKANDLARKALTASWDLANKKTTKPSVSAQIFDSIMDRGGLARRTEQKSDMTFQGISPQEREEKRSDLAKLLLLKRQGT